MNHHQNHQLNFYCLDFTCGLHGLSPGLLWALHACCIKTYFICVFSLLPTSFCGDFSSKSKSDPGCLLSVYLSRCVQTGMFVYLEFLGTMSSDGQGIQFPLFCVACAVLHLGYHSGHDDGDDDDDEETTITRYRLFTKNMRADNYFLS